MKKSHRQWATRLYVHGSYTTTILFISSSPLVTWSSIVNLKISYTFVKRARTHHPLRSYLQLNKINFSNRFQTTSKCYIYLLVLTLLKQLRTLLPHNTWTHASNARSRAGFRGIKCFAATTYVIKAYTRELAPATNLCTATSRGDKSIMWASHFCH